jgi:hypothetical protein
MSLEDLPTLEIGGITDPIGQAINWLWSQISGGLNSLLSGLKDFINSLIGGIKSVTDKLASFASALSSAFIDFVKDPIGKIQGALSYVWSITPSWIKDPISFLASLASQVGGAMITFFKDPLGALKGLADFIWSITPAFIRDPLTNLANFLSNIGGAFIDFLKDPIGKITSAFAWVGNQLSPIVTSLRDAASKIGDLVKMPVDALSAGISSVLSGKVFDWFSSAFAQAIGGVGDAIINAIVAPVANFFNEQIAKPFKEFMQNVWQNIMKGASQVAAWGQANVVEPMMGAIGWIVDRLKGVMSDFYSKSLGFLEGLMSQSPEAALSDAPKKAAELGILGLGVGALGALASTKIVGCGLELDSLMQAFQNFLKPDLFLNPIVSGMIGAGIGIQIQRALNAKYQTRLPDTKTAYELLREKLISEEDFYKYASYEGWSRGLAAKLLDLWDYDPTIGDLITLSNYIELDDSFISQVYDINRFPAKYRPYWSEMIKLRPLRNEISSYIGAVLAMRGNGYWTKEAFLKALDDAQSEKWIKSREVELRKLQADLSFSRNLLEVKVDTLKYMFRKGKITPDQLEAQLRALGLDPLMANAIKENELARAGLLELAA